MIRPGAAIAALAYGPCQGKQTWDNTRSMIASQSQRREYGRLVRAISGELGPELVVDYPSTFFSAQLMAPFTQVGEEKFNVVSVFGFLDSAVAILIGICFAIE
jgi:hypothetical protein